MSRPSTGQLLHEARRELRKAQTFIDDFNYSLSAEELGDSYASRITLDVNRSLTILHELLDTATDAYANQL